MHAAHALVDRRQPPRNILLDVGRQRPQAEFDAGRDPRLRGKRRYRIGSQSRLVRRECRRAEADKTKCREAGLS